MAKCIQLSPFAKIQVDVLQKIAWLDEGEIIGPTLYEVNEQHVYVKYRSVLRVC